MTIHVNIGEAKTRLSELVTAAVRGEEVVLDKAGAPQVRLVPVIDAAADFEQVAAKRLTVIGLWAKAFENYDTSLAALKADHSDPDERFRGKFGYTD